LSDRGQEEPFFAVHGHVDGVALLLKTLLNEPTQIGIVFDEQEPHDAQWPDPLRLDDTTIGIESHSFSLRGDPAGAPDAAPPRPTVRLPANRPRHGHGSRPAVRITRRLSWPPRRKALCHN